MYRLAWLWDPNFHRGFSHHLSKYTWAEKRTPPTFRRRGVEVSTPRLVAGMNCKPLLSFYAQMKMMMSQWLLFRTTAFFSSDHIIFYTTWGSTFNCGKKTLLWN